MKKVLITGKNSYIGQSFKSYVEANYPSEIQVDSISVRGNTWREYDFSGYDAVMHVAALVHKNEKNIPLERYLVVNRNLALAVAKKAQLAGVKHFIFISTVAVYAKTNHITEQTKLKPVTKYGLSKLKAEQELISLRSKKFTISIVRPPMIYGKDCPGNFAKLRAIALKIPIFPKVSNDRSMIFIDNLSEFLAQLSLFPKNLMLIPQNLKYSNTSNILRLIRRSSGKKTVFVPGFEPLIKFIALYNKTIAKVYGSLIIDRDLSGDLVNYAKIDLPNSINRIEGSDV